MQPGDLATKADIQVLMQKIDELKSQQSSQKTSPRKQVYSLKEACVVLGVSEGTFRKMEGMGIIRGGSYLPEEHMGKRLYKASVIHKLVDNLLPD